jgi:hypothetical protein
MSNVHSCAQKKKGRVCYKKMDVLAHDLESSLIQKLLAVGIAVVGAIYFMGRAQDYDYDDEYNAGPVANQKSTTSSSSLDTFLPKKEKETSGGDGEKKGDWWSDNKSDFDVVETRTESDNEIPSSSFR